MVISCKKINITQQVHYNSITAFTLIELLVVITIISVLAAILFPVFSSAREKARLISCSSNEKQFALAFLQYQQDNDAGLPSPGDGFSDPSTSWRVGAGWAGDIFPYVKATGVYQCPSDDTALLVDDTTPSGSVKISYIYNADLVDTYDYANNVPGSLHIPTAPSSTVLLVEGRGTTPVEVENPAEGQCINPGQALTSAAGSGVDIYQADVSDPCVDSVTFYDAGDLGGYNNAVRATLFTNGGAGYYKDVGRHSEGSNFLLLDGHVKWLHGEQVSVGYTPSTTTDPQASANSNGFPIAAGTEGLLPSGKNPAATFSPI